jgi:pimeloyl-ACP methyl ester carboxylesterase
MLTPVSLLIGLLIGLLSLAIPLTGALLLWLSARRSKRTIRAERIHERPNQLKNTTSERSAHKSEHVRLLPWRERWREPGVLVPLLAGVFLLLLPFGFGRGLVRYAFPAGVDEPHAFQGAVQELTRPDGTKIHAEVFGSDNAPQLVLTHGWGTTSTEWYYTKKNLAGRFRVIVWDLPGLGQTEQPKDGSDSLEQMATDLHQVLSIAQGKPVVLVGHSIGGMTDLTFAKLYPESLGSQVKGVVQIDTTYTNPVRTTSHSRLNMALQKPLAEPILHLMIPFSPIVRIVNWISYQEGILYLKNASSSFAGSETGGQVDLVSRMQVQSSPGVVARGTLAMFHWDGTTVLPQINVPVLILVGKQDTTTLPSASATMERSIPRAQMQIIDRSSHYALLEKNEVVNDAISQFAAVVLR